MNDVATHIAWFAGFSTLLAPPLPPHMIAFLYPPNSAIVQSHGSPSCAFVSVLVSTLA